MVVDNDLYNSAKTTNYNISSVVLNGDLLKIKIGSSGCDANSWKATLVDANKILESNPIQRNIKVLIENNGACLAVFEKEFTFDIQILKENYSEVILNLEKWNPQINYK